MSIRYSLLLATCVAIALLTPLTRGGDLAFVAVTIPDPDPLPCRKKVEIKAFGINDDDDVVGTLRCMQGSQVQEVHAFVYFDTGHGGTGADARTTLLLSPATGFSWGGLNDINNRVDGINIAVGWTSTSLSGPGPSSEAAYWELDVTLPVGTSLLDTTEGFGINNLDVNDDFSLVGEEDSGAFLFESASSLITSLVDFSGADTSIALDIDDDGFIVGTSGDCIFLVPPETGICNGMSPCFTQNSDAVAWDPNAVPALDIEALLQPVGFEVQGGTDEIAGSAAQIATTGAIVGWGRECQQPGNDIPARALFWQDANDTDPDNLGLAFDLSNPTYARGINGTDFPFVVGRNDSGNFAVLWYDGDPSPTSEDWYGVDLNTLLPAGVGPPATNDVPVVFHSPGDASSGLAIVGVDEATESFAAADQSDSGFWNASNEDVAKSLVRTIEVVMCSVLLDRVVKMCLITPTRHAEPSPQHNHVLVATGCQRRE